jgi:hypothetical protein
MKTYVLDIIPKLKKHSLKLDELTNLVDYNWVMYNEDLESKKIYIFRKKNELLVSTDGRVEKGNWEYINNECILIDIFSKSFLLRLEFIDETYLILKSDIKRNDAGYTIFVNESKSQKMLNSIEDIQEYFSDMYGGGEDSESENYEDLIGDEWKEDA